MDEKELEEYLRQIDRVESAKLGETTLLEQMRDEEGFRVDGCFRVLPIETEE